MTKCIVHGCKNHRHEGRFIGELCGPCHTILTTGKVTPSYAWFVVEIERLQKALQDIYELHHTANHIVERDDRTLDIVCEALGEASDGTMD